VVGLRLGVTIGGPPSLAPLLVARLRTLVCTLVETSQLKSHVHSSISESLMISCRFYDPLNLLLARSHATLPLPQPSPHKLRHQTITLV
jgi:hypothetical protein